MDPADLGRVVVEQPDEPVVGLEVRRRAPRATRGRGRRARSTSPGVEVAADPDRPAVVEPAVGPARVRCMRNQRGPSRRTRYGMTCLNAGSTSIAGRGSNRPARAIAARIASAPSVRIPSQPGAGHDERARDDVDQLVDAGADHRPRAAVGRPRTVRRRCGRIGSGRARARPATRRARPRSPAAPAAISAAFVAAIPAPIAGSPPASRVMSRQPPAASDRAERPVRAGGHGLDEGRGDDERRWLIAATAAIVGRRIEPDGPGTAAPGRAARPGRRRLARRRRRGQTTHGRSTNRSAARGRVARRVSRPAIG